ncbi:alpha-galactosidase [Microbacteriaceae bacterium VKM Ac-2854]|nr:alpha-galactosidase [Microbacteriaceae bacterium VKM Ac-2854]
MPEPLLRWGELTFSIAPDAPVAVLGIGSGPLLDAALAQPLVEVSAFGHGRFPGGFRHVDTVIGARLRYLDHTEAPGALRIRQTDRLTGLQVVSVFERRAEVPAFRTWTEVTGDGLVLDFVSTFATGSFLAESSVDDLSLASAENDWVAESRWSVRPLREIGLARIDRELQHHPPRSRHVTQNRGSWSSGEQAPTAALLGGGTALAWQVEHNGPWLFEIGETRRGAYLLLSGPTDQEHQFSHALVAGEAFVSVPASVAYAEGGIDEVWAALTAQRRAIRLDRDADRALPVIFNDYMNTLMGDPTTAKLLPLIDAAAEAGADAFCVDAGWYAEGHWWDTVGEWQPAASRFPGGLGEVIARIRSHGMIAGLWLEPEVIGVRSPLAATLPDEAFFSRGGVRVAEHGRHLLDLRSAAARAHLDEVVDRIVAEYGVDFIKMDYNTMPGPGTDLGDISPGAGLLGHARALLDWIDAVQARHPSLLIESCASGAMRMDYAMLARLHLQSTSDQQDPVLYASIAAAAPASILPEQSGNWAYPLAGTDPELMTLALVNGVLGRMYLSGYLNRMSAAERELVHEAVTAQKTVLATIEDALPFWPLGLPGWSDEWLALGLRSDDAAYLSVWRRPGVASSIVLPLPAWRGAALEVAPFFPNDSGDWTWRWNAEAGELHVTAPVGPSARVLRVTAA